MSARTLQKSFAYNGVERKQARAMISRLTKEFPPEHAFLHFTTPVQLLVAVILSAQCTDKKVNEVTATLFKKYRTAKDFANISQRELERAVMPTGFFRQKAKHIRAAASLLVSHHNGKLPNTIAELIQLPGVGRKTANVVLQVGIGKREGIPVDTHVGRIARRWKLSSSLDPDVVEHALIRAFPQKDWSRVPYMMILLGRTYCVARKPACTDCPLNTMCPSSLVTTKKKKQLLRALPAE